MNGGGGNQPPPPSYPPAYEGDYLLQLLQRPPHQPPTHRQQPPLPKYAATRPLPPTPFPPPPARNHSHDPAVAAVGPSPPFPPFPSNVHGLPYQRPPWSHPPPFAPHNFFHQGFPQNPNPNPNHSWSPSPRPSEINRNHHNNLQFNRQGLPDDIRRLGFVGSNPRPNSAHHHQQNLVFGSLPHEIRNNERVQDGNKHWRSNGFEVNFQNSPNFSRNQPANSHAFQQDSGNFREGVPSPGIRRPALGLPSRPRHTVDKEKSSFGELSYRGSTSNHEGKRQKKLLPKHRKIGGDTIAEPRLSSKLDCPEPPAGSNLQSDSASDIEESLLESYGEIGENGKKPRLQDNVRRGGGPVPSELEELIEQLMGSSVLDDGSDDKNDRKPYQSSRGKDHRSNTRGKGLLSLKKREFERNVKCRSDIDRLNAPFLAVYEALIPPAEEKEKQQQLLTLLEKLVSKEWPEARLCVYGSCANSFGIVKSDIDVCLTIEDPDVNKSEVLLKLAGILQSDNLHNVKALTHARVPIVKLMDPVTGISCDICINNDLAVVNTKLLRDYAKIDMRLRQLACIVKHWAKSRGVNRTYKGTLSSYAYVVMCIHFLQQRKPAILPCLQEMERTYVVTSENIECAYFDQVEKLYGFGAHNRESIAELVWAFFNYWAYCHDYENDVVSIRTGSTLSKREKEWTMRTRNGRHLICIEDPFEISHDLGRVVRQRTLRVLREEFERAAKIMQHGPHPALFEPYIAS